ncbi:MAG: DEAD/DEAH box helicase [Gaiellales bacterium]
MSNPRAFADIPGISQRTIDALSAKGITHTFPIQDLVLEDALAGKDVLAKAPTGSGKTFAFAIPIIERTTVDMPKPAAVILVPTRELCVQVMEEFEILLEGSEIQAAPVYGGTNLETQAKRAEKAHVIVATPGRLLDLLNRGLIDTSHVRSFVLDEADRMLDMGFQPQTDRIEAAMPKDRHTMFFSATLDGRAGRIAKRYTHEPLMFQVARAEGEDSKITHRFIKVGRGTKMAALTELLEEDIAKPGLTLIFSRTKRGADSLNRDLNSRGIPTEAMHGDMPQNVREKTLAKFERGELKMLVATDVAARGLDLDDITHVIHFDAPDDRADYVHRSGRTGRAGRDGLATCLISDEDEYVMGRVAEDLGLEEDYLAAGLRIIPPRMAYSGKGKTGTRHLAGWGTKATTTHKRPGPRR